MSAAPKKTSAAKTPARKASTPKKSSEAAPAKKSVPAGAASKGASAKKPAPAAVPAKKVSSPYVSALEALGTVHLEKAAAAMRKRGFEASVADSLADAARLVMEELLPASKAKTVAFGGSMTVMQSGLYDALKAHKGVTVMDTNDMSNGIEALLEVRRQALLSDFFLCSANAVTMQGELLLMDGFGNRTAALQFGPKKVVVLVGRNKLCADVEEGISRIRNVAAPANGIRLGKKTPCVKSGHCMDCNLPERMCYNLVVKSGSNPVGRVHVVLVNEDAGY